MFEDVFRLDSRRPAAEAFAHVSAAPRRPFAPGVYSDGLITIFGESFAHDWLQSWPPLAGRLEPFAYTAFGEVFAWDTLKNVVQYLEVQYAKLTKACDSIDELFDEVLVRPGVIDQLLFRGLLEQVQRLHGPIEYGQCYIAVPWQMLGGGGKPETFDRGAVDVYLSLVGQAHPFT